MGTSHPGTSKIAVDQLFRNDTKTRLQDEEINTPRG
jgi:hypothetical protein